MPNINLYFLSNFNNYYNRQLKKPNEKNVSAYEPFALIKTVQKFDPGDNVNTMLEGMLFARETYDGTIEYTDDVDVDYLLVSYDGETVNSKWYIIEKTRNRKGQWTLTLRRDLLADYFDAISSSPVFIEKGWISSTDNPFIYNTENMTFNQIKKKEYLLKDQANTAWIVGYLARNIFADTANINITASAQVSSEFSFPEVSLTDVQYYYDTFGSNGFRGPSVGTGFPRIYALLQYTIPDTTVVFSNLNTTSAGTNDDINKNWNVLFTGGLYDYDDTAIDIRDAYVNYRDEFTVLGKDLGRNASQDTIDELLKYSGQTVKDPTTGKLFTYTLKYDGAGQSETTINRGSTFYDKYVDLVNEVYNNADFQSRTITMNTDSGAVSGFRWINSHNYYVMSEPQIVSTDAEITGSIMSTINKPNDAPYYIFAMPYHPITIAHEYESGEVWSETKTYYTKLILEAVMNHFGPGQFLYDVQLLPFTPSELLAALDPYSSTPEFLLKDGRGSAHDVSKFYYTNEYGENRIATCMFWLKSSSFRNTIPFNVELPTDPVEFKVENETKKYRLVSPNYAGAFEFTATKNGGINGFEVNCTLKPYNPYIHINPVFGGLYGGDFDDNRGLICGGDFTIPQISDAWRDYQIQNKSYMDAFNRQIENIELTNSIQREREIVGLITGGISATIGGAGGGILAAGGNPAGALVGVATGAASIAAGMYDLKISDKLRAEGLDYTKDQFGYQLQNIQARPNTVSRTSAFDINNKLFPFVEVYDCTEEEKDALRDKIKYNGMTIMAISNIKKYTDNNSRYVKGQLIRLIDKENNSVGEYHEAAEIASELMKGVFI